MGLSCILWDYLKENCLDLVVCFSAFTENKNVLISNCSQTLFCIFEPHAIVDSSLIFLASEEF